ncbi:MAG: hypothetical protein QXV64_00545 [Candidatus Anstonellaceae archaeon]
MVQQKVKEKNTEEQKEKKIGEVLKLTVPKKNISQEQKKIEKPQEEYAKKTPQKEKQNPKPKPAPKQKQKPQKPQQPKPQPQQEIEEKIPPIKYEELTDQQKSEFEKIKAIVEDLKEGEETFIDARTLKKLGRNGLKYLEQYLDSNKYYYEYFTIIKTIDGEYVPTEEIGLYIYKQRRDEEEVDEMEENIT